MNKKGVKKLKTIMYSVIWIFDRKCKTFLFKISNKINDQPDTTVSTYDIMFPGPGSNPRFGSSN